MLTSSTVGHFGSWSYNIIYGWVPRKTRFRAILGRLEGKLKTILGKIKIELEKNKRLHNDGLDLIFTDIRGQIIQIGIQQYTNRVTRCG